MHVAADGFTLFLRKGGHDRSDHLTGHNGRVDLLFLKEHADTDGLQFTDSFQAVDSVAGKAGDGLSQHPVDQSSPAVRRQPLKVIALVRNGSADAFVGIDVYQLPTIMGGDKVCVIPVLCGVGIELLVRGGAYTGIGGNAERNCFRLLCSRYGYDSPFTLRNGKISTNIQHLLQAFTSPLQQHTIPWKP